MLLDKNIEEMFHKIWIYPQFLHDEVLPTSFAKAPLALLRWPAELMLCILVILYKDSWKMGADDQRSRTLLPPGPLS
jgi:hypothetical protein